MKLPVSWLKQYVDINVPLDDYVSKMIMIGNGVEGYERLDAQIENVVVGRILSLAKHPNADALQICQIDVGAEVVQIVTGATNIAENDYIPVALDGALLPGGKRIKTGKLRGELSRGMLCSGTELDVPAELYPHCGEEGILILTEPHTPGSPIAPILGIDEIIVDYEVLANRPDCLCVQGIARESAVALGLPAVKLPEINVTECGGDVNEHIAVRIVDPDLCMRYCARVVKNIKIGPSPVWMRRALHAAGIRPINNIVDITNYVMLEMGQPMHAFDLSAVRGGEIIVRRAKDGEIIRTLDGKERALTDNMLAIADREGATALAGVMGGEGSEITADTKEILFEAACFLRSSVRQTSRALGLRTESSGRFERGVNVHGVRRALDRAAQLIVELGAGEVVSGVVDVYPNPEKLEPVRVSPAYVRRITGVDVSTDDMKHILSSLNMEVSGTDDELTVTPPDYRQDIAIDADIAEEVLRVYGYDNIPSTLPTAVVAEGKRGSRKAFERRISRMLSGAGYLEVRCNAFQSPKTFDRLLLSADDMRRRYVAVRNPLGEDYSAMRTTLIGSMLEVIALNVSRGNSSSCFFELAPRYLPSELPIKDTLPAEPLTLSLGAYGEGQDFYAVKGVAELILRGLGLDSQASWRRGSEPYLHPGRSAELFVCGERIGFIGEAHPDALDNFNIHCRACVGELDAERLMELAVRMTDVDPVPKVPAVTRDLALVMRAETPAGDVLDCIRKAVGALCEQASIFDIYTGTPIETGYKSVAYSMTLRAADHTLTEEEIEGAFKRAVKACEKQFEARLRG